MRTREEIEDEVHSISDYNWAERTTIASLEVLLDIRDLLTPHSGSHGTGSITATPNSPVNYARVTTHCPDCTGYGGNVYYEGECPKHKQL